MKKVLLLAIAASFGFSSCNNDDDKGTSPAPAENTWALVNVSGGFAGSTSTFTKTEILWRFDADGTVNINNTNTDTSKEDFFDSGTYTYSIKDNTTQIETCPKAMQVDVMNFSCYKIQNDSLVLDNGFADGHTLIFIKP